MPSREFTIINEELMNGRVDHHDSTSQESPPDDAPSLDQQTYGPKPEGDDRPSEASPYVNCDDQKENTTHGSQKIRALMPKSP